MKNNSNFPHFVKNFPHFMKNSPHFVKNIMYYGKLCTHLVRYRLERIKKQELVKLEKGCKK